MSGCGRHEFDEPYYNCAFCNPEMNYKLIDCWLVFETDVECNSNGDLRKVLFNVKDAIAECRRNVWTSIDAAKAINVTDSNGVEHRFVLRFNEEVNRLGNDAKQQLRESALSKLTKEEVAVLRELGVR